MDHNYGPIFRRLWTKVHQITSADAGEIVVCNAVFRLSISCSIPEIFAIEVRSRPKSRQKACFSASIFWGRPQILDLVFKIAPISDHVAKFRGDRPRDRGDLALNKKRKEKKRKKETAAKHKGRGCVIATGGPNKRLMQSDWLVEQSLTPHPTQYRSFRRRIDWYQRG